MICFFWKARVRAHKSEVQATLKNADFKFFIKLEASKISTFFNEEKNKNLLGSYML